ncbi:hypothetical protein DFH08DRAFT_827040 [Mycena albidolilacea]|uniref:Uncharacterized protein n=1 Tax=Mycena albidolilacea TaxID=1033008 RepID=A0AAD7E7I4_9AGAR|nr:hypothetical protein DFH08DRAFT_827040 [Mycena albidolilacea]
MAVTGGRGVACGVAWLVLGYTIHFHWSIPVHPDVHLDQIEQSEKTSMLINLHALINVPRFKLNLLPHSTAEWLAHAIWQAAGVGSNSMEMSIPVVSTQAILSAQWLVIA